MSDGYNPIDAPTGDTDKPKWKRYLNICAIVLGAVVGLIMLIVSVVAYSQINGFINDYDSVVNSWEATPVMTLTFQSSSTSCSEPIFNTWPGLYPACNCDVPNHTGNSSSTTTTACSQQQINDNCQDLPVHAGPANLYMFPVTQLCLGRAGPDTLNRPSDPTNCGSGYRVCGSNVGNGTTGSGGAFCWPTSQSQCPITDFVLDTTQYSQAQSGADDPVQLIYTYPGGNTWWLYVKRGGVLNNLWPQREGGAFNPTGLPVTDIAFNPADPCTLSGCGYSGRASEYAADSTAYHSASPQYGYVQKPLPCDGGCLAPSGSGSVSPSGRDLRYSRTMLSISETSLYTQTGGIPSQFITTNANYQWYLQYRSEIEWSSTCPESRSEVVSRQSDVNKVKTLEVVLLVFGILSFLFLSLYFPIAECCAKPETKEKMERPHLYCKVCLKGTVLIVTIVTAVIAYSTLAFWNSINSGSSCSDALTDETFASLGHKFSDLSYNNYLNTASAGATALGDVVVGLVTKFL